MVDLIKDLPWPEINSLPGFFLYSFLAYLLVMLLGWCFNPVIDETLNPDPAKEALRRQGEIMRNKNLKKE